MSVYATSVTLPAGKTVQSVTLPTISNGVGDSPNAMHLFAMGSQGELTRGANAAFRAAVSALGGAAP